MPPTVASAVQRAQRNCRGLVDHRLSRCLNALLAGCRVQHAATRCLSRGLRRAQTGNPSRIRWRPASVFWHEAINLPPEKQRAVIGPFHAQRLEEYRIGLGPRHEDALYHGVVWPMLGVEDEQVDMAVEIEQVLRRLG